MDKVWFNLCVYVCVCVCAHDPKDQNSCYLFDYAKKNCPVLILQRLTVLFGLIRRLYCCVRIVAVPIWYPFMINVMSLEGCLLYVNMKGNPVIVNGYNF